MGKNEAYTSPFIAPLYNKKSFAVAQDGKGLPTELYLSLKSKTL
ncbi:hypothetical protein [Mucilaginibacter sp.]